MSDHSLRSLWALLLVTLLICPGAAVAEQPEAQEREAGFVPLFDGRLLRACPKRGLTLSGEAKNAIRTTRLQRVRPLFGQALSGWEGNGAWFRVEQGAIVAGRLDQRIPQNQFLCTTRSFGDFELRLQVKLVGPGANAGIQFRSSRIPGSEEVRGYQADAGEAAGRSVWGGLYDESRRRKFLAPPEDAALDANLETLVKPEEWNDYRIRCVGAKVELYLNGVQTVDYTESDPAVEREGIIGLQIHSGPPAEAWYRNLRIKPL